MLNLHYTISNFLQVEQTKEEKGTPLTIIIWVLLVICCVAWTSTVWIAAKKCDSCSKIPIPLRFDCHPDGKISQESCLARNCCWNPPNSYQDSYQSQNIPVCIKEKTMGTTKN